MKRWSCIIFAMIFFALPVAGWAQPTVPPVPKTSIYVQDYAKVLSEEVKAKINRAGTAVQQKTKAQLVVVTVDTLNGAPIEEYALEILRKWGIGDKELNNGVLLLVAVNDRTSRIEVGYGLEGALPDGKTGRVQDEFMLSYFKDGDYSSGILNGYMALSQEILQEYKTTAADVNAPVAKVKAPESKSVMDTIIDMIGIGIVIVLIVLDFMFFGGRFTMLILSLISRRGGGGGYGGGSGGGGGSSRKW